MNPSVEVNSHLLTRNWGLNLGGQVLALIVAVATIPYVLHGLGPERFGILSIAYAVLGPLSLLDLGLGRATTKFVADCLGRGDVLRLPALVWTSLALQSLVGVVGTILVFAAAPRFVGHFLKVSPSLVAEAVTSFLILAASLPFMLAGNALRGVLEAAQRFDLVNYVKVPASIATYLVSVVAVAFGSHLPGVMWLLAVSRLAVALAYLLLCLKVFPVLKECRSFNLKLMRPLLAYGGWVTVSNVIGPLLTYLDRLIIGTVVPVSSVPYYAAPNEAITKATVVPASLVATLFPAFASLEASGSRNKLEELSARSLKLLILLMGPILLLVILFAQELLRIWLGPEFAAQGTLVLQIFAVGVLFNAVAFVPFGLLQGLGRPDLTAKFHLVELPLYAIALWLLLPRFGLVGAALAWTLRLCLDAILLLGAAFWLRHMSFRAVWSSTLERPIVAVLVFGAFILALALAGGRLTSQLLLGGLLLLAFVIVVWRVVLDQKEKNLFFTAAGQLRSAIGRAK